MRISDWSSDVCSSDLSRSRKTGSRRRCKAKPSAVRNWQARTEASDWDSSFRVLREREVERHDRRDQTKRFDHREAQEQTARDARFGIGIAERALEVAAEHVADADTGEARTHRREAGTDELGCFWIHDLSSLGLTSVT